jgi:hypothetical protein
MADRRVIVDQEAESDRRLLYVLEEMGRMQAEHEERMAKACAEQIAAAMERHTERMVQDSDMAKPYWVSGSEHIGAHWWDRFSKRFTVAVLMAGLAVLLAVGTYLAARLGVIK